MKTLRKTLILSLFALICLGTHTHSLQGQSPQQAPIIADKKPTIRAVPFRGIVGKVDIKTQTFTLKNKSNKLIRIFKVTPETRFELDKEKRTLKELKVDQQVRGSCIKTGDRTYTAKLVRWSSPAKPTASPEKPTQKPAP